MPAKALPSVEYLRECFLHDQDAGVLIWKTRPQSHFSDHRAWKTCNARLAGEVVGTIHKGYLRVCIDGSLFKVHRVIWKLMTGEEPPESPDHKDGNKLNNRWENLRPATHYGQMWNCSLQKNNTSGFRGVWLTKSGTWASQITVNYVQYYLGVFATAKEASAVYDAKACELHGDFFRR